MKLAFYQGRSFISRLIRFVTWGKYSHIAVILDDGRILEAWHQPNGVRWIKHLGDGHTAGTLVDVFTVPDLPHKESAELCAHCSVGGKYDFWGIFGFVLRRSLHNRKKWFCSELAATICKVGGVDLIARTPPWKISPSLLATSPLLKPYGRAITGKTRTVIHPYPSPATVQPNDSITDGDSATVSPKADTAGAGEFCYRDCASFVCADTGRCWKLDCCPDVSKRETKRVEVLTTEQTKDTEGMKP